MIFIARPFLHSLPENRSTSPLRPSALSQLHYPSLWLLNLFHFCMFPFFYFCFLIWCLWDAKWIKVRVYFSVLFIAISHYGCSISMNKWVNIFLFIPPLYYKSILILTMAGFFCIKCGTLILFPSLKYCWTSETIFCLVLYSFVKIFQYQRYHLFRC